MVLATGLQHLEVGGSSMPSDPQTGHLDIRAVSTDMTEDIVVLGHKMACLGIGSPVLSSKEVLLTFPTLSESNQICGDFHCQKQNILFPV